MRRDLRQTKEGKQKWRGREWVGEGRQRQLGEQRTAGEVRGEPKGSRRRIGIREKRREQGRQGRVGEGTRGSKEREGEGRDPSSFS